MAFTLVTPKDFEFAGHLVRSLEGVGQDVPKPLLDLAMQVEIIFIVILEPMSNFYQIMLLFTSELMVQKKSFQRWQG